MGIFSEEPDARLAILGGVSPGSVLRIESNGNILGGAWRAPCHSRDASCDRFRSEHDVCASRATLLAKTFGVSSVVERLVYTLFKAFFTTSSR